MSRRGGQDTGGWEAEVLEDEGEVWEVKKAYFLSFVIIVGPILMPESSESRPRIEPAPSKVEFGNLFWLRTRPGGAPGVP